MLLNMSEKEILNMIDVLLLLHSYQLLVVCWKLMCFKNLLENGASMDNCGFSQVEYGSLRTER